MKTQWDYTTLASHYLKRPDYAGAAIDRICQLAGVGPGDSACDIGAGSAHLTKLLLDRGLLVTAVEPNDEMRKVGQSVTSGRQVTWIEGTGENTGLPGATFNLVTFGSSFNTTDRSAALVETSRLLRPNGWFACLWNHRNLSDSLQAEVEAYIRSNISGYSYGTRREDQAPIISASKLFQAPHYIEASHQVEMAAEDYVEAWRSHATLQRQAGSDFAAIIMGIEKIIMPYGATLQVGYTTRAWAAQKRS